MTCGGRRLGSARFGALLAGLLVLTAGLMVVGWIGMRAVGRGANEPVDADWDALEAAALASMTIPEFEFVDQDGRPATREIFLGRWTILAFTFTHCPAVCPVMNSRLVRLQAELEGVPVRTVSISVDPERDTPQALRAHADRIGADLARWSFLTGDQAAVDRIVASLGFGALGEAGEPIALADGSTIPNIVHPSKLLLIGPDGRVRAMESGLEWAAVESLGRRARRLALAETRPASR